MTSYDEILTSMQEKYYSEAGFYADDASDIGIRLRVLAVQLAALTDKAEAIKTEIFPQTAGGEKLDYHAQTRGLRRKESAPSFGSLRFSRGTPAPTESIIPAGTVCAVSRGDEGVELRFVTTAQGVIAAGGSFADIPAKADAGGVLTNTAPGAINVMITPVGAVSSVTNPAAFTGGADGETDEMLRARLMRSFAQINNGTNAAFYYDFAMGFEGVASANVVPRASGKGTVGVYVAGRGAAAPDALVEKISLGLNAAKEINVDVSVQSAALKPIDIALELDGKGGADFDSLKLACEERLADYLNSLAVGQGLLRAGIADALYHTEGLYNYKLTAPAGDTRAAAGELLTLGELTISRMAVVT